MKGYKKVCALRTFTVRGSSVLPGAEVWLHDLAADAAVRRGDAIHVGEFTVEQGRSADSLMRELAKLDLKIDAIRKSLSPLENRRAEVAEQIAKLNSEWVDGEASEVDEDDESDESDDESDLSSVLMPSTLTPVNKMNRDQIVEELSARGVDGYTPTDRRSTLVAALKKERGEE